MSAGLPYFQCFPSDFLAGLSGLSPEEQVVYFTIVLRNYDLGGPVLLRHYERDLCQRADVTKRKLMVILESLVDRRKLELVAEGAYQNPRAAVEIEKISTIFEKNRVAAVSGGRANARRIAREKNDEKKMGLFNENSPTMEPTGSKVAKPKTSQSAYSGLAETGAETKPNPESRIQKTQTSLVDSKPARDLASSSPPADDRFEALRVDCSNALGPDLAPDDFVIGPMMLLADEIGRDKLLVILRSERDRPRRNKPRSWSIWAQNVRERLPAYEAAAYSTGMKAPEGANAAPVAYPQADPDGRTIKVPPPRNAMPWSEFRRHVERFDRDGYWPMSLGPEPGRSGCLASPDEVATMRSELASGVAA